MPIVPNVQLPVFCAPKPQDVTDIPTLRSDPRFSGYELLRDGDGNIVQFNRVASQPAFWSFTSLDTDNEILLDP